MTGIVKAVLVLLMVAVVGASALFVWSRLGSARSERPLVVRFQFRPGSMEFIGPEGEKAASRALARIAELVRRHEGARFLIEGHTDSAMKDRGVPVETVLELTLARAKAVRNRLCAAHGFDPARFDVAGRGWDVPFDRGDILNHRLNRRIEVRVLPDGAE